jgi:hypothetical protein
MSQSLQQQKSLETKGSKKNSFCIKSFSPFQGKERKKELKTELKSPEKKLKSLCNPYNLCI